MKDDLPLAVRDVVSYYERHSNEASVSSVNGQPSVYLPSSPRNIALGLTGMIKGGFISPKQRFLDAGAGDGRVVAIASAFGFDSFGIEFSKAAHLKAEERFLDLTQQDLIDSSVAKVVRGDFTEDGPFASKAFDSFPVIFHAHNNVDAIVSRISGQSPKGTIFLYYTTRGPAPGFEVPANLHFVTGLRLTDGQKGMVAPSLGFLMAYRKV